MADASAIGGRFAAVRRSLNERGRRLFAAAEARTAGYGGISASARATGIARSTIGRGLKDLDDPGALSGVISIDTKKKELIGPYKNVGSDYRPQGCPDAVLVHDFINDELGRVVPYGVYDIAANAGCVSVGIDNDTAPFAVNSIRRWLDVMGRERYPNADRLMITADGGGSNGSRVRLFKVELQKLADETGMTVQVCHFPPGTSKWNPGTSKWNKVEHRLFCHMTHTNRPKP